MRIVSRRNQGLASEAPRVKNELDKFMKLSQNKGVMLNDTEILLEIYRRNKNYRLRWRFDGQGSVLEEQLNSSWQNVEVGDIKERFPISIYSQKQINELATNPKGLLEIVDRSPEVDRVGWKARWESVKSQFLRFRERQREFLRQLIIVTHNPNIVVNGDAELIHVLKFENGQVQIDQQGGLEEKKIRDAICTIMEGSRKAFDKRYKRITLEFKHV